MEEAILKKTKIILEELLKKDSNISLFAILKVNETNSWDFVVAGKNLNPTPDNLKWVADIVRKELSPNEAIVVSRLVLLPSINTFVKNMNSAIEVEKNANYMKIENYQASNILVKEGYVIYSVPVV